MPVEMSWVEDGWPDGKPLSCGAWNNGNGSGHAIAVDVDKNTAESLAASKAEELAGNEYTKGWRCPDGCTPSRDDPNNGVKNPAREAPTVKVQVPGGAVPVWRARYKCEYVKRMYCQGLPRPKRKSRR